MLAHGTLQQGPNRKINYREKGEKQILQQHSGERGVNITNYLIDGFNTKLQIHYPTVFHSPVAGFFYSLHISILGKTIHCSLGPDFTL